MVDLSVTPEQVRSRSNIWLLCSYHVGIRRQEEVPESPPPGITFPADAGMLIAPTPGGMAKLSWPETVAYPSTNQVTRRVTLTKPRPRVNTLFLPFKLCGRVPDLQSGSCGFESRPGLLRIKVYAAFHPSGVGKWVSAAAGKAKAGMAHSDCGWTCGCAGKTVKSLENTCHTWALLRCCFTTKRRYIECTHLYLYLSPSFPPKSGGPENFA